MTSKTKTILAAVGIVGFGLVWGLWSEWPEMMNRDTDEDTAPRAAATVLPEKPAPLQTQGKQLAMYAIYEKKGGNLSLFEDEEAEFVDLNEAEEILRQLRKENPGEYDRIANLRDGIRAAKPNSVQKGLYVFCQADRFQQLFLLDEQGETVSRDIPKVLGAIKCGPDLQGGQLPKDYNAAVMRVKRQFAEEVKHREAEREHTLSLTHGQRYVLRELRVLFGAADDEDQKAQINALERAFRAQNLTSAVKKELNLIRRNSLTSQALFKSLARVYQQHNLRDLVDRQRDGSEQPIPKIVCSEALM
jgi:hypothetical protein